MLIPILRSIFTIEQAHAGIIERFGKFHRVVEPGLHVKFPYIDRLAAILSLKIEQNSVTADTKTKDNVFVKVNIAVNYRVVSGREREAYYTLSDAKAQIQAYVLDVARSKIPGMTLDEVFERKDDVAQAVTQHLSELDAAIRLRDREFTRCRCAARCFCRRRDERNLGAVAPPGRRPGERPRPTRFWR